MNVQEGREFPEAGVAFQDTISMALTEKDKKARKNHLFPIFIRKSVVF